MSRDAFFESVRQAYRGSFPYASTEGGKADVAAAERALQAADHWLTPKAVEGYEPTDFAYLPLPAQNELADAVNGFLRVTSGIAPNAPATQAQRDDAWSNFSRILRLVREQVIAEWTHAVETIFRLVEELAAAEGWATKRYPKGMSDAFLGPYETCQLLIHRRDARFMLDPVSRYAPGTTGLIDLYVIPSLGGTMISQVNGAWRIHPLQHGQPLQPFTPDAFKNALDGLARAAA